jgi:hypothetical protein
MEWGPAAESINVGHSWHVGEKHAEATQYGARRAREVSLPPSPIWLANNSESGLPCDDPSPEGHGADLPR